MNAKKILALMLCAMMLLSLAACGAKDNDKQADMSGDSSGRTRFCRKIPSCGKRFSWRPTRA